MSSTSSSGWSSVINNFISAIQGVLSEIGSVLAQNASTIADILIGIGIVYFVIRYFDKIPFVGNLLNNLMP